MKTIKYLAIDTTGADVGDDIIPSTINSMFLTNTTAAAIIVNVFEGGSGGYGAETGNQKFKFVVPANTTLPAGSIGGAEFKQHLHVTASAASVDVSITGEFVG